MYMLTNKNNKLLLSSSSSECDLEARISIFIFYDSKLNKACLTRKAIPERDINPNTNRVNGTIVALGLHLVETLSPMRLNAYVPV